MKKIVIKNGTIIAPSDGYINEVLDIYVEDGKIKEIGYNLEKECEVLDVSDCIVSAGFIDIHTHCFDKKANLGVDADVIGVQRGSTSIFDAGSAGADTFRHFIEHVIKGHKTKVFSLLNVSKEGLLSLRELDCLEKIDLCKIRLMIINYPEHIKGLKVRASSSVVGDMGIEPIKIAAQIAKELDLPLMVHVGNAPPSLRDVLNLLKKGDIVTHGFHGKNGGIIDENQQVIQEAIDAKNRGVLFDIGHGSASFSFDTYQNAKQLGFFADFISTDVHQGNYEKLVYSQHAVISKLINMNEKLEDLIDKVTARPADHFKLDKIGHLKVGYDADLSISRLVNCDESEKDSMGHELHMLKKLIPIYTIISQEGSSELIDNENYKKSRDL